MIYSQVNFVEAASRRVLMDGVCAKSEDFPAYRVDTVPTKGFPEVPYVVLGPVTFAHTKIAITGELAAGKFLNRVDNTFRSLRRLLRVQYLEVDLSGIAAIDKTGIHVLQRNIKAARACGAGVAVTNAPVEFELSLAAAEIPFRKSEGGTRP